MRSFASDNNSGVHPLVMEALNRANIDHSLGYGDDKWTEEAVAKIKETFTPNCVPLFVFNGTGSNVVALQLMTRPYHSIFCAETAHIYVDECGSPVKMTGCRLTDFAHLNGMYVHMDGARIANACAALNLSLKELTVDCGVDILSFGGTKNGLMMGECVIVFNKDLQPEARFIRKQSAQLASKMRYLSCQFTAYLTDNLWLKNANHANAMAAKLYTELKKLPEVTFTQKAESNQLFLTMPRPVIDRMLESYFFYFWNEERNEIRLVTSFDTTEEDVDEFIRLLKR